MSMSTPKIVRAAQQAVERLVTKCYKGSPLYVQNPKAVAQVSRTSKWLLNAIAKLPSGAGQSCAENGQK